MNGNPQVPASSGGRSDAPTVIGAGCAQILLPGKGMRPTIALTPSIWGRSGSDERNQCCSSTQSIRSPLH